MKNLLLAICLFIGLSLSAQETEFNAYVKSSFFDGGTELCRVYIYEGDCASGIMISQGGRIVWTITELKCGIPLSEVDERYLDFAPYRLRTGETTYLSNVALMPMNPFEFWETEGTTLVREFKFEGVRHFIRIDIQTDYSDGKKI